MKRKFCEWIYRKNESLFGEIMVRSFYENIPSKLEEPATNFFYNNRDILERFLTIQAYWITRRSLGDVKRQEFYSGILFYIKSLISIAQRGKIVTPQVEIKEPEKNELDSVNKFIEDAKKI